MDFLFERLARANGELAPADAKEQLQLDILRQVQCIVASRPWPDPADASDPPHLLSFGIGAVPELARGNVGQLERYGRRLAQLVKRYEPRLASPKVTIEPDANPMSPLRIVVTGFLQQEGQPRDARPVRLEAHSPHR